MNEKMPLNLRILLSIMVGASTLIVFGFSTQLSGVNRFGSAALVGLEDNEVSAAETDKKISVLNPACPDIDKDGLCNSEEAIYGTDPLNPDTDGDGFLDGEEVAAGCSPLIPKPNDCNLGDLKRGALLTPQLNLTDYFSFLIAGSFPFNQPDQSGPEFEESVVSLSDEAARIKITLLSADDSAIKIKTSKNDTEAARRKYLDESAGLLKKYLSDADEKIKVADLDALYGELSKIEPPAGLADFHKRLLKSLIGSRVYLSNLDEQKDPVRTLLTLEGANNLVSDLEEVKTEVRAIHDSPGNVVPVYDESLTEMIHEIFERESEARRQGRQILQDLSNNIIDTIRGMGRQGAAAGADANFFVQNFRNLSLEGQARGESFWRGLLGYAANPDNEILCRHIRESQAFNSLGPTEVEGLVGSEEGGSVVRRSVSADDDYIVLSQCDPFVDENFDLWQQDFSAGGGWAMLDLLSKPQNNIFGALDAALRERDRQIKIEREADLDEVNSGSGYLGQRQCAAFGPGGQCVVWGPATIPSNLAAAAVNAVLNQNLAYISEVSKKDYGGELDNIRDYVLRLTLRVFGLEAFPF